MLINQDFYLSRNDKCQDSTPSGDHLPYMEEVILLCHTQKRGKQHQIFLFMHLDKILNLFDNRCMHQEKVQIPADRSPNAPPPPQDLLMACSPSDTQSHSYHYLKTSGSLFLLNVSYVSIESQELAISLNFWGWKTKNQERTLGQFFNSSPRLEFMLTLSVRWVPQCVKESFIQ